MSEINGNLFRLKFGGVLLGGTTSVSISFSKDLQETTNQDSSGKVEYHSTSGKIGAKGSFDGFYDPDGTFNAEEIIDIINNKSGLVVCQVGSTAAEYWEFSATFSDVSIDTKNDSVPTIKGSFSSSGVMLKKSNAVIIPTIIDAAAGDHILEITFNTPMVDPASFLADFGVTINATPANLTSVGIQPETFDYVYGIVFTDTLSTGQTVILSIASGNIKSVSGGTLAEVINKEVTNSL